MICSGPTAAAMMSRSKWYAQARSVLLNIDVAADALQARPEAAVRFETSERDSKSPAVLARMYAAAERWSPVCARLVLGLVLLWFGYHEATDPALWTGYVPVVSATSVLAKVLVSAHACMLIVLAVASLVGIVPRVAAAITSLLLAEIVISLAVTGGLSDLVARDLGVMGLAVAVVGLPQRRLILTR